ncbi:MAG: hypothetical protein FWF55_07950 [Treponema sp.]|nr:hypothetical protein [Treponema sp.]
MLIRITDRTLSCVDDRAGNKPALARFLKFLVKMDPGAIELSEKMYSLLSPLPEYHYILRIDKPADAKKYQADSYITEFICRNVPASAPIDAREKIRAEILLNNTLKTSSETIARYAGYANVRIQGLDYLMCDDYMRAFEYLKKVFNSNGNAGRIEFCPRNHFNCATALAAEWITGDMGTNIVTSFGGIGGFAPTEEVIMILREYRLRGEDKIYGFFPEMAQLFHRLTKKNISPNKPIIGSGVFHVESGVHVDGILKQPKCYEPFAPEIVGQKRKIVLGKHSGTASIIAKLSEFDIKCPQDNIPLILEQIKNKAVEENGEVTDWDFVKLLKEQNARERGS